MTSDQLLVFAILAATMGLFLWGRFRYDVVALGALMAAVLSGVVPAATAFDGFGNAAVITVAAVLIISRTLQLSGLIDAIAARVAALARGQTSQIGALGGLAAVLSAFMNNVGALALLMPVALRSVSRPSRVLMPLSFGSILGGLVTLIGTPPNIIVASFRADATGAGFSMFDFAPVGLPVAVAGLLFVVFIGWRLIPGDRKGRKSAEDLFEIRDYIAELRLPDDSDLIGQPASAIEHAAEGEALVVGILRGERRSVIHAHREILRSGDIVLTRADATTIDKLVTGKALELVADDELTAATLHSADMALIEAVVTPGARIEGRTPDALALRRRYGATLLALARQGGAVTRRLGRTPLQAGDVLLLQGHVDDLPEAVTRLGCLPLAERGLNRGATRHAWIPAAVFALSVTATAIGLVPVHIAFMAAVLALVLLNRIAVRQAYDAIDWPVIVLLGAMIPLGQAMQATGATALVADAIAATATALPTIFVLGLVLVVTMTLSYLMNNAATAIVMAPIGIAIADRLDASPDAFLMAVAVGASCAFLTPIGHQNNVLVMGPGGYRFADYWRMGLPLEILIVVVATPLIAAVWGL